MARGRQRERRFENGVRLGAAESRAGHAAESGHGLEDVSLEQLASGLATSRQTPGEVAGGSDCAGQGDGAAAEGENYQAIRRGWCLGAEPFRKELLAQRMERVGAEHDGAERLETDPAKAERSVSAELKPRRWQAVDLAKGTPGDPGQVDLAGRLRAETVMTVKWIAERLQMGTASYLNNRWSRWRKETLGRKQSSKQYQEPTPFRPLFLFDPFSFLFFPF